MKQILPFSMRLGECRKATLKGGLSLLQIYAVAISHFPNTQLIPLLSCVSREKSDKLSRFHHQEDLIRGLVGDLLVRKVISETLAVPVKRIVFGTNSYGKPYLAIPDNNSFHYNVSHSGDWVVCAIDDSPVGIDIERIQPVQLEISRRFFAREEVEFIEQAPSDDQKQERFFAVWTAKESYIKAIGQGLSHSLNNFSTVREGSVEGLRVFDHCDWYLKAYSLDDSYALAVCGQKPQACETVRVISPDDIIGYFLDDHGQQNVHVH